jgi:uncharacterized integral membrane protein
VLKVLFIMLLAATAATFAMDNMHHVGIGLIVGGPVYVRLFFLLLTSFLSGCFITMLMHLFLSARARRHNQPVQDVVEDEPFFSE